MAKTQQNISQRTTKCSHRRPILSCPYSKRQNTALATIRDVGVSCSQSAPNRLPSFFSLGIKARENGEKRRIEQSKPSNSRPCASDSENQIPNEARPLPEIKSGQAPTAKGSSGSCNRGIKKLRTFGKFAAYSFWSGRQDSNLRPSAPKADALARLRHAPFPKEDDKPSQNDCLSMLFQKILN